MELQKNLPCENSNNAAKVAQEGTWVAATRLLMEILLIGNTMNIKPSKLTLPTLAIGALLMTIFHSAAMASPIGHCDQKQMSREQMNPEKVQERMKARLDKLAEQLEIKSSQQPAWSEFAKSVVTLAEQGVKKPNDDADAATISRYRAEKATEFAKKLTRIADATEKLQAVLAEDQRKTLNQASRHFLLKSHERRHESNEHEWGRHGSYEDEPLRDEHDEDSR